MRARIVCKHVCVRVYLAERENTTTCVGICIVLKTVFVGLLIGFSFDDNLVVRVT